MRITQNYNLLLKELIVASELQFDLNQLFTVINAIDKDNLSRPGSVFDWGNTKLNNVNDPLGEINDSTDLQAAVTKNYLQAKLFAAGKFFDPATGNWHLHSNKAILDSITDAGDGAIPSAAERARFLTQDQKDAMTNAHVPTSANPVATIADIPAVSGDVHIVALSNYGTGVVSGSRLPHKAGGGSLLFGNRRLFVGWLEGEAVGGIFNGWGRVEFTIAWNGAQMDVMLTDWWEGVPEAHVGWNKHTIANDAVGENARAITIGGRTWPRVMTLTDGVRIDIGRVVPGVGVLEMMQFGSGLEFTLLNQGPVTWSAAKIGLFGWQR